MGIIIKDHSDDALGDLAVKIPAALEAIGLQAEGNAKTEITNMKAVDTGRLRNSITHGVLDEKSVAIGTNVEYAAFIEYGTSKMAARPYLKNALNNYTKEYKQILESALKND